MVNDTAKRNDHSSRMAPTYVEGIPLLQVASNSPPPSVAGAIAGCVRESRRCYVQAIGAGAVNQMVKAIAIARGYVAPSGDDLVCVPMFHDVMIESEERTTIRMLVQPRGK